MAKAMRSIASSPTFRCDPFVRDEVFDHGRVPAPRLAALLMLPSALSTASASAFIALSRLNSSPHIIAVYASQRSLPPAPQHSLPGGRLHLTRAGLAPAGSRQLRGALRGATFPPAGDVRCEHWSCHRTLASKVRRHASRLADQAPRRMRRPQSSVRSGSRSNIAASRGEHHLISRAPFSGHFLAVSKTSRK